MKKKITILFILLLFNTVFVFAQSFTIESVPDPKKAEGGYISDPSNILRDETKATINSLFAALEQKTSNQIALVILPSIGEEVPKDFAYKLFNYWGIGIKGKDNGLLMLLVMDQHRVEFETGYGMEAVLPDAVCKRIQMNYMVPRFKEEAYDQGVLDGVKATVDILENPENSSYFNEMDTLETNGDSEGKNSFVGILAIVFAATSGITFLVKRSQKTFTDLYGNASAEQKKKTVLIISKRRWVILYAIIPFLMFLYMYFFLDVRNYLTNSSAILYIYFLIILIEKRIRSNARYAQNYRQKDYYENYKKYTKAHEYWFWTAFFFPIPFLFYVLFYLREKNSLRNHPRDCSNCSSPLLKLDEKADDQHLSKSQLLEEQLKSIDYDVWYCGSCSSKQVLSYKNVFSKYSECGSCKTRAYYLYSNVTLEAATYDSSGTGQKTFKCKYCGYTKTETYTIPRKERSSSSSSGGGGGSSWGGGSSGGGGSGSSW